jgi:hypothetical protein
MRATLAHLCLWPPTLINSHALFINFEQLRSLMRVDSFRYAKLVLVRPGHETIGFNLFNTTIHWLYPCLVIGSESMRVICYHCSLNENESGSEPVHENSFATVPRVSSCLFSPILVNIVLYCS